MVIRRGDRRDLPFMRAMLTRAYSWHVNTLDTSIPSTRYLEGWGRQGDTALVALEEGHPIGAGWYRLFDQEDAGYGFLDERTPEATLAAVPSREGTDVIRLLLAGLIERGRFEAHPAISISLECEHPSLAVYEAAGFVVVDKDEQAVTLRMPLDQGGSEQ
jgi:hypothetical protein